MKSNSMTKQHDYNPIDDPKADWKAIAAQRAMDIVYWKNEVQKLNKRIEELENQLANDHGSFCECSWCT